MFSEEKLEENKKQAEEYLENRIKLRDEMEDLMELLYKISELDIGKSLEHLIYYPKEKRHRVLTNMEFVEQIKLDLTDVNEDIEKLVTISEKGYWRDGE